MNIYVLMKQTFDTEERIVIQDGQVSEDGVKFVINPYDEYAVEEAIRLKEKEGGTVVVLSAGPERAAEALRTALAMGADEAVLLSDDRLPQDEYSVSKALAAYLAAESYDLLLGGNFSVDHGAGQVAIRLAQLLDLPHASSVTKLTVSGGKAVAERDAEGDAETVELTLPALVTAQQGLNEPRYPSLPGIMKAKKKPFRRLTLEDVGLTEDDVAPRTERLSLSLPPERQAGRLLKGDPAQQAAELVSLLRTEAKVI
ncbi:electron transfer flavoprotein subunit beta/FixA family protein [Paenibacillus aurantius]|uniref:Electron transfer flavoprotein subunit beta n=1 Tax=Paenibacillus aurantius TaxID=2918900 RepID=A0AA96RJB0_9BACL|nr:electron transfer flavoprotein subunit beta/FixA family protein [Paenibacillus aurantius]WNQ13049.1 electron transfer flavoprotein subunit beta/FixA family protein [Paenibacillus aurantius]